MKRSMNVSAQGDGDAISSGTLEGDRGLVGAMKMNIVNARGGARQGGTLGDTMEDLGKLTMSSVFEILSFKCDPIVDISIV